MSLPSHTFSLPSQIFLSVTNSKMLFVYYICNYATYVTLNDAEVKEYSKNIYIPDLNFDIMTHKPFQYSVDVTKII